MPTPLPADTSVLDELVSMGGRPIPLRDFYSQVNRATPTRPETPAFLDARRQAVEDQLASLAGTQERLFFPGTGATLIPARDREVHVQHSDQGPTLSLRSTHAIKGGSRIGPGEEFTITDDLSPEEREYRLRRAVGLPNPAAIHAKYAAQDRAARAALRVGVGQGSEAAPATGGRKIGVKKKGG